MISAFKPILHIALSATILICSVACRQTKPQRPTFLHQPVQTEEQKAVSEMVLLNQRMAEEADQLLASIVKEGYVNEDNIWVRGHLSSDTMLHAGQSILLHKQVCQLDGAVLEDVETNGYIGQIEDIPAVVAVLPFMERGDTLHIYAPWYQAYGSLGSPQVPPYTNVQIELTIH